ncbi:Tetratricopeptide repeat (TPR)-like superfamily protein [Thalictrum thalictroides]|uniref:Tetratricopeptide repeat (TPR)-like superfamily protein n=1 Tax=Thalictrum thalictroides TaxID=46969 RepID=A0A7J6V5L4_THATH|nr:Tetratricopeptide repeat (TPR)-like superfamily protein [Thalictrum thalictroides]
MNSKPNNASKGSAVSLNNFNFDFDLGSNFSNNRSSQQPLKDQKQQTPYTSSYVQQAQQPKPAAMSSWTPNKPSWTHQPAPSQSVRSELLNPVSMVGDIHGKSWASKTPSNSTTSASSGIGLVEKNPNLFSDLLGSALGQNKSSGNVPLKNAPPVKVTASQGKSSYSMGNLASSLPKTGGAPLKSGSNWGSGENLGNLGGPSMKSGTANKDPFGSFVGFGFKKEQGVKLNATKSSNGNNAVDNSFGDFQNAGKPSASSFPSAQSASTKNKSVGDFDVPIQNFSSQKQPPAQSQGVDHLDALFSSSSGQTSASQMRSDAPGSEPFSEMADWDVGADFGGGDVGTTTELEGLPPPPAGVTASTAKNKGLDSYKQGQHADAIKWLSWAVVLLEKGGDSATTKEVLVCRASCYKEVGEYKKAIADCTKVIEEDGANISVLLQRALLYESTEKYKLGAEDLRTVMKIDPGNRLARSTIHRLLQLAE